MKILALVSLMVFAAGVNGDPQWGHVCTQCDMEHPQEFMCQADMGE